MLKWWKLEGTMSLIGEWIGQYEIISLLGEGGMAAVYRARQKSINRDVAIKVITRLGQNPEFLMRFQREAQTIASLSHAHILKVFDFGQQDGLVYLVMELLKGGGLENYIRRGPIAPNKVSRALDQIASALEYAHNRGIIHRDLKPQNLLLDDAGHIFLTDFGVAKLVNETVGATQTGMALGTPAYMAPELWQSDHVDRRTDIYSLGVMLFEMLTGRLPFDSDTPYRLMYQHIHESPPSLTTLMPDLPPELEIIVNRALAKDPAMRFNTAGELLVAFRQALSPNSAPSVRTAVGGDARASQTGPLIAIPVAVPVSTPAPSFVPGTPRNDDRGLPQVWVSPGCFMMGSPPGYNVRTEECPEHEVCITNGFWLDQYPVTNAAFQEFIEDGGYKNRQIWSNAGWQWLSVNNIKKPGNYPGHDDPVQPRVGVSWFEADAYARWRGGRLPTEAEWEYAARGPDSLKYPWGNTYEDGKANVRARRIKPVSAYPDGRSWSDAFDLIGNVWEWVADWYDEAYYREDVKNDPPGPTSGKTRVLRGGSWRHDQNLARAAARRPDAPLTRDDYIGFRIVTPMK
jgi:serine/threonine protein kinase